MSRLLGRIIHWLAVVLLFIAAALLLVTTISAPVIPDIAILKVELKNQSDIRHSSVTFGSFGHCILDVAPAQSDQDYCYPKTIGYAPASIIGYIDHTTFPIAKSSTADDLTYSFVLHPIACAVAFSAALSGCVGVIGSFAGSLVALLAFFISVIVMAMDFAVFGIVKDHVNADGSGSHAYYSVGMWTCLAGTVLLFLAGFMLLFSGCSERKKGSGRHTESWSGSSLYEKNEHTTPYTRRNHEQLKAGKPYESSKREEDSPAPTTNSEASTKVEKPGHTPGHTGKEIVVCDECGNKMAICKKCGNRTNYPYGNGRPTLDYAAARKSQNRTKTQLSNSTPRSGGKSPSLWPAPPTVPSDVHLSELSSNRANTNNYDSGLHPSRIHDVGSSNSNSNTAVNERDSPGILQPTRVHDYGDTGSNSFNKSAAVSPGPLSARNLGGDQFGYGRRGVGTAPVHDRTTQGVAF